jgi:putative addiction module component (TIGR02574 family)
MQSFESILGAAEQLPIADQLRLIEAIWNSVPPEVEIPLHPDWVLELTERVARLENGTAKTIPWETIRQEALARIGYANAD